MRSSRDVRTLLLLLLLLLLLVLLIFMLMLMLVLDPSPREAEPFTRITRRIAPPLFPSRSVPNSIASLQCAAFIEKSGLTTGGSLPGYLRCLPPRRSPFPSSVIPSRGDDEGPPLWSDHPSSFTSSHPD